LRGPGGCPWDQKQTHETRRKYLTEECTEVLEALESGNDAAFEEELGDVLLQLLLHAQIASERGAFDFASIVSRLNAKLVFRHPHVFDGQPIPADEQALSDQWERLKALQKATKNPE
ncbi:MAG TPA: MazG nucleotide pyrophosphohydrolase domain-containing protein, partial [Opitutales bacterium]|nr:MazG nucleotide pyrophosphohydrolase domain-containing protein [Opitutales bacterium]